MYFVDRLRMTDERGRTTTRLDPVDDDPERPWWRRLVVVPGL